MRYAILLALLSGQPQTGGIASPEAGSVPRPFHEIHRDMRALLRAEATARTKPARAAAVYQLTQIYTEIRRDPRLDTSDTLKSYKARLWGRLTQVRDQIRKELSRQQRRRDRSAKSSDDDQLSAVARSLADALSLVGGSSGGPARLLSQVDGSFGGGAIPDYGPELVSLIQRTIVPEFWDVHGGPGTIVYYRPLMVLVVRATDDVHHRLGGVVRGVRRAGK